MASHATASPRTNHGGTVGPMRYRRLGGRGPEISVIGYGAWEIGGESYGPNPDESAVVRALHAGFDAGINWVDTAEVYGMGRSESLVGKALRTTDAEILVATKVAPQPVGSGFEPARVRRACERSLHRLRRECIDLFQLHWLPEDESWPLEDTWGAMADLLRDGLVRAIGVSNFGRDEIERCLAIEHVDALQPHFSMLHREDDDLLAWCGERGIGVLVYGPLAYGLLTGTLDTSSAFDASDWRSGSSPSHSYYREFFAPDRLPANLELVERLRPIAARVGCAVGQLALAWTVHRPGVTSAIAGSRNPAHNRQNAEAGDLGLDDATLAEIDALLG